MAYAEINGTKLAWQQMGSGPHLLLVHGLAANRAFWFPHALKLQAHYTVTLFDLPGHGYSDRPDSGYDCISMGRSLLALMDQVGIDSAVLAGHSYGGGACIEAAVLAPERVNGLALFDVRNARIQPTMRMVDIDRLTPFEEEVHADNSVDWAAEQQVGIRFLEVAARHRVAGRVSQANDPIIPFGEGRGAMKAARQWLSLLDETDARRGFDQPGAPLDALAQLTLPSLLWYADRSHCRYSGDALQTLWPHCDYRVLGDAGHFFPLTHADQVTQTLADWAGDHASDRTSLRAAS